MFPLAIGDIEHLCVAIDYFYFFICEYLVYVLYPNFYLTFYAYISGEI